MAYYKNIENNYIVSIGENTGGTIISESEYDEIAETIQNKPQENELIGYRLKTDLTWESYEKDPPDPDLDDSELVEILLGGDAE